MTTNDFEDCQVVFSHSVIWDEFQEWMQRRGLSLFPIPVGEDDLPTHGIGTLAA